MLPFDWSLCLEHETELFIRFFQVGLIIGRGGETIKSLQSRSGARIQVCCRSCMPWKPFNIVSYHLCSWTQWVGRNVTLFGFSIFNWWSIQVPTRCTIIKALTWWETIAMPSLMFFVFLFFVVFVFPSLELSVASWRSVNLAVGFFFIMRMEISLFLWKMYYQSINLMRNNSKDMTTHSSHVYFGLAGIDQTVIVEFSLQSKQ